MKWKFLGPGLLYAGAAVGVSHLVQSTRAGAMYGFDLLLAVLLVNLIKYPFFEIGTRYTISTGKVLQSGYLDIGRWAVWIFLGITVGTMFIIVSVVSVVTAGLFQNLTGVMIDLWVWSGVILSLSIGILLYGQYKALNTLIKAVILLLTLSTLVNLGMAIFETSDRVILKHNHFDFGLSTDVIFLVALLGWMPIPIEAAVWQSDWTLEARKNNDGELPSMKYALLDFKVGYWGTTILALCFLSLGALSMYGTGEEFSSSAVVFSDQLVKLISKNLGTWAYPFIALAASLTMISTTFTVLDAYPRVVTKTIQVLYPNKEWNSTRSYWILMVILGIGSLLLLALFQKSMRTMVDFATSVSFVTAPILAFFHYKISRSPAVEDTNPIGFWMILLSKIGLVFLSAFAIYFIYLEFFI
jgi:Mn2+/Fe2+ NRAMP family transporter